MFRVQKLLTRSVGVAASLGLYVATGNGQAASPRTVLGMFAPPAIERGISPVAVKAWRASRASTGQARSVTADRAGASGVRYRPGRVVVKFRDAVPAASRIATLAAVSRAATMSPRAVYQNFDVVQVDAAADPEAVARSLRARPDVEYAQAAYRVHRMLVPDDEFYPQQWNLPLIDMERAWDVQPAAGSAITVAVLDTGIAYTNATLNFTASGFCLDADQEVNPTPCLAGETQYPALGNLTLQFAAATELGPSTRFVAPHDFIWGDGLPLDLEGHGTHVSGTVGQLTNNRFNGLGDVSHGGGTAGVAFNVKLMPVKVLDTQWDNIFGAPNVGTDDIVALGIRYAADNGAKVINMSLGRTGPTNCGTNPNQDGCAPVVEDAIRYAVSKGVFVAIAAGNEFDTGSPTEVIAEIASRVAGAVSVSAVNQARGHASYSSAGSWVELAAPGGDFGLFGAVGGVLQQTLDLDLAEIMDLAGPIAPSRLVAPRFDVLDYFFLAGTSMATPHVSGVAAMLMQQGVTNPGAIEAALEHFALPCSEARNVCEASIAANRNSQFGFGLLQARSVLRGLGLGR